MKILVAFYSRTGHNRKLSSELAVALHADIEEIVDLKSRKGIVGWIIGGRDSMTKQLTDIRKPTKKPSDYGLTILVSPLWVGTAAPAMRKYIIENKGKFKKVSIAAVSGSGDSQSISSDVEDLSGIKITSMLHISDAEFKKDYKYKFDNFTNKLKLL